MNDQEKSKEHLIEELERNSLSSMLERAKERDIPWTDDRFAELVLNSSDIYFRHDFRGRYTSVSGAVERILGYLPEEMLRLNYKDLVDPDDWERAEEDFFSKVHGFTLVSKPYEVVFWRKDGTPVWMEVSTRVVERDGAPIEVYGIARDINARKRAEERILMAEARCASFVMNSVVPVMSWDIRGMVEYANVPMLELLGLSQSDSQPINVFRHPVLIDTGIADAIRQCHETGEPLIHEVPIRSGQPGSRDVRLRIVPVRDDDGRMLGGQASAAEVPQTARTDSQENLKPPVRMARSIAKTFDRLVQFTVGRARKGLALLESGQSGELEPILKEILYQNLREAQTIRNLHYLGRTPREIRAGRTEVFDLSDAVREAMEIRRLWTGEQDSVRKQVLPDTDLATECFVEGNRSHIIEAVVNLLRNAEECFVQAGTTNVSTASDGDQIVLKVQDDGPGLGSKDSERIFEPFWSSKDAHLGIGLAVTVGIVGRHGGTVAVKTKKGRGTTITLAFPKAHRSQDPERTASSEFPDEGHRILIIDDEPTIAITAGRGLTRLGQITYVASSGGEAIDVCRTHEIDAVICDMAIAGTDGLAVCREIRTTLERKAPERPPLIILTAHPHTLPASGELDSCVDRVIEKPVPFSRLLEIVREEIRNRGR